MSKTGVTANMLYNTYLNNNMFLILVPVVDILFRVAERIRKQNTAFLLFSLCK